MKRLSLLTLLVGFGCGLHAQPCRVIDTELQQSYAGLCVNGLAEGIGSATGTASYQGQFSAGRKHGKGVKTWANGDRYEGDFFEDRIEGFGAYVFGRGPWAGERYEGDYLAGRRHGHGVYRWGSGDVYIGPWQDDVATGNLTPMMLAQATFLKEARAAMAKPGQKVCREFQVGIGGREWVRGTVVASAEDKVAVRIDQLPSQSNALAEVSKVGEIVWDSLLAWTPCF